MGCHYTLLTAGRAVRARLHRALQHLFEKTPCGLALNPNGQQAFDIRLVAQSGAYV